MTWIAHVNEVSSQVKFHLNIPAGSHIPRIGDIVFASSNNGREGEYRTIIKILDCRKYYTKILGRRHIFVSVDYIAREVKYVGVAE